MLEVHKQAVLEQISKQEIGNKRKHVFQIFYGEHLKLKQTYKSTGDIYQHETR